MSDASSTARDAQAIAMQVRCALGWMKAGIADPAVDDIIAEMRQGVRRVRALCGDNGIDRVEVRPWAHGWFVIDERGAHLSKRQERVTLDAPRISDEAGYDGDAAGLVQHPMMARGAAAPHIARVLEAVRLSVV